jgi:hypothetical protein
MAEKFKPKYIMWHDSDFYSSPRVSRRLDWLDRHLYRALCIQAMFCDSRPYLPSADSELALLADCPIETWVEHKENVLSMFVEYTGDEGEVLGWSHKRILGDWKKYEKSQKQFKKLSKAGVDARRTARSQDGHRTATNRTDTEQNTTETQQNTTSNRTLQRPNSDRNSTGRVRAQEKPATTSLSDGGLDGDLDGAGSDGLEHDREESGYNAPDLVAYFYEHMPTLKLGVRASSDLQTMTELVCEYGGRAVGLAMEWAFFKSDYWAKPGKGALAGVYGFAKAFSLILEQRQRWAETALKRKKR